MLTPSFNVSQTEAIVTITIRVRYVKISEAEIYLHDSTFKFYCNPYFLHLELPGQLAEDGLEKTSYDADTGTLTVQASKCHHGEHFANLEMLTTLLPHNKTKDLRTVGKKPLIEVVEPEGEGQEGACGGSEGGREEEEEEEEFDWTIEQTLPSDEQCSDLLSGLVPYGFALQHQGVFMKLQEEIPNIVECPDPDHMTPHERRVARVAGEEAAFNQDHYLADLMDNPYIQELLGHKPPWKSQLAKWREKSTSSSTKNEEPGPDIVPFTSAERDKLKSLHNRDYLLDKATKRSLYLGLVDIIFAYAYNYRSTEGEGTVESAWNICKLSSTLSWLEVFRGGLHEVIYCSLRRCLCYPLYRHWGLAQAVLQDTRDLFRLGRRKLLQCLLDVRDILNSCEPYYILNNLYITDYTTWLQRASVKQIQKLADELDEVRVELSSLGWGLTELESAAHLTAQEAEEGGTTEAEEACPEGICPEGLCPEETCPEETCPEGICPEKVLIEEIEIEGSSSEWETSSSSDTTCSSSDSVSETEEND